MIIFDYLKALSDLYRLQYLNKQNLIDFNAVKSEYYNLQERIELLINEMTDEEIEIVNTLSNNLYNLIYS